MIHPAALLCTGILMMMVALALTALFLAWSIPAWRRGLGEKGTEPAYRASLKGWPARLGSAAVSLGIGIAASVAWAGCYWVLATSGFLTR